MRVLLSTYDSRGGVEPLDNVRDHILGDHPWLAADPTLAHCFAVGEVNQQALFGRVAAVVHHGGAGTTTTAARAGVPQVVVPQRVSRERPPVTA